MQLISPVVFWAEELPTLENQEEMICSFYSGTAEKVDHSCYVQVGFLHQQTQFDQRKAMDIYLDDITNLTDNF